ncbi:deSI-like protein At4g17486 isoform X3 [Argentina anserina]|uniref:deSI-like protein At4g17486 isoform X3 n=1 Tax=Argentina anserina TaxID=57926 RepID=UPI0021763144|nr:deSI-like protein At4g17486 isoform X3 [Potentilla anserina]
MGAESTSSSGGGIDRSDKRYETPVILNVYDLTPMNNYSVWVGLGIFHSGIEVHGKEYGFGAHDLPVSGVFEVEPKACPGFIYRSSISLGRINMSPSEFRTFIENVAAEYHGDTYHLISKNCNHFTDDMAFRLTERQIPGWVNRLARLGSLCSCLLPESLQVTTVKQTPEYHHESEEDGTESLTITTPRESTEVDDDQEKRLLSPLAAISPVCGWGDVTIVKEAQTIKAA